MPTKPIVHRAKHKILVVDDHPVFREGLATVVNQEKDLQVCGDTSDSREAIKIISAAKPDLVVLDISLEGTNGIDLTKQIRSDYANLPVLILSAHPESLYADRALRAGANGYIMKRESRTKIVEAMRQVLRGQIYVSPAMNEILLQNMANAGRHSPLNPLEKLSDSEFEIFQLIGKGYGTRQIADNLHLSMKTVESHREHIRAKLNLSTTFELVQRAIHWIHQETLTPTTLVGKYKRLADD